MAETYSSAKYAVPDLIALRQVELLTNWGSSIPVGASVLELGCADGFVTEKLTAAGFRVTAVDFSSRMIDVASRRLSEAGQTADLRVASVDDFEPEDRYDAVLAMMRTFFHYVEDPGRVLRRLASSSCRKVLVDLNPRAFSLGKAIEILKASGFADVSWRGFFLPDMRVSPAAAALLRFAEKTPLLNTALLSRRFNAVTKGEASPGNPR